MLNSKKKTSYISEVLIVNLFKIKFQVKLEKETKQANIHLAQKFERENSQHKHKTHKFEIKKASEAATFKTY